MSSSLPITFSGWELEVQGTVSELGTVVELDSPTASVEKLQGKYIEWTLDRNANTTPFVQTNLAGVDELGRLVFLGDPWERNCHNFPPGIPVPPILPPEMRSVVVETWRNDRGSVIGVIKLEASQFGPSTKYKIGLTVHAKTTRGVLRHQSPNVGGWACTSFSHIDYTPCRVWIMGTSAESPQMGDHPDQGFNIRLTVETDAIDFNREHPGQTIECGFFLAGKRIVIERIILSKKVF